jgi:dCMP deaminase
MTNFVDWLPYLKQCPDIFNAYNPLNIKEQLFNVYRLAQNSKDPSTQTSARILDEYGAPIGDGYNRFTYGIKYTDERLNDRNTKLRFMEHAERSAIYDAAEEGFSTRNAIMICPWYSCDSCARGVIQSGIRTIIGHKACFDKTPERWRESIIAAFEMFEAAQINCLAWEGVVGCKPIRFNGELWHP